MIQLTWSLCYSICSLLLYIENFFKYYIATYEAQGMFKFANLVVKTSLTESYFHYVTALNFLIILIIGFPISVNCIDPKTLFIIYCKFTSLIFIIGVLSNKRRIYLDKYTRAFLICCLHCVSKFIYSNVSLHCFAINFFLDSITYITNATFPKN